MIVKEPWYSRFKWFIMIVLPAFSSAYFAASDILDLPAVAQVCGMCAILATFLGGVLGISNSNYQNSEERYDGDLVITKTEDGQTFRFVMNTEPEVMEIKDELKFKKVLEVV